MVGQSELSRYKLALGAVALAIAFLASLHFVFGVSPLITLTIILSFLIVLIAAGGCALHLKEIERYEEAEALDKMKERVNLHLQFINEILIPAKARLENCEAHVVSKPGLFLDSPKNLASARRIIVALEERMDKLMALVNDSADPEQLFQANEICEALLLTKVDLVSASLEPDLIPNLESHLWRDTLDMLLIQTEKQLREKADAAA